MSDKMILSSEHEEQAAVVEYCRWRKIPVYHTPNEGKRSYWQAAHLAAAGMESGVPDLCIPVPKGGKGALYIEMKHGRGKLTPKDNAQEADTETISIVATPLDNGMVKASTTEDTPAAVFDAWNTTPYMPVTDATTP